MLTKERGHEQGFILVFALVMLLVITLLGVTAMHTSTIEQYIAGNQQSFEQNLNVADGGTLVQAGALGYVKRRWYKMSDPRKTDSFMIPSLPGTTGISDWDPCGGAAAKDLPPSVSKLTAQNPDMWPRDNLTRNGSTCNDTTTDYTYLVTYLYPDKPPKGYDASKFSTYLFRFNAHRSVDVERGGNLVGVRFTF